jgi:probable HAF family extracellular repeat protein
MNTRCPRPSSFLAAALLVACPASFLAAGQPQYNAVCVDPSGYYCFAYGINNSGQVVGEFSNSDGQYHAFLYSEGPITDLGTLGGSA